MGITNYGVLPWISVLHYHSKIWLQQIASLTFWFWRKSQRRKISNKSRTKELVCRFSKRLPPHQFSPQTLQCKGHRSKCTKELWKSGNDPYFLEIAPKFCSNPLSSHWRHFWLLNLSHLMLHTQWNEGKFDNWKLHWFMILKLEINTFLTQVILTLV